MCSEMSASASSYSRRSSGSLASVSGHGLGFASARTRRPPGLRSSPLSSRGQRAADADHRQRFEAEPEDPARRAEPLGRRRTRRRRGFQRLARLERRSGAAGRGLFAAEGGADQGVVAGPVEPVPDSGGAAEAAEGVAEGFPGRDVAGQVGVRLWRAERLQEQAAAVVFGGDRFQPAGDRAQGAHFFAAALQREGAAERGDPFQRRVEGGDRDPRRGPFEFVGVLLAADLGGDRAAAPGWT